MMQIHNLDVRHLKDMRGYKPILKAVLRGQIQQLVEQLSEYTGEETVVLSASLTEGTMCHLGSKRARDFLIGRDEIKSQFLAYCINSEELIMEDKTTESDSGSPSPKKRKEMKRKERPFSLKKEPVTKGSSSQSRPGTGKKKQVLKVVLKDSLEGQTTDDVAEVVDRMIAKQMDKAGKKTAPEGTRRHLRNTRASLSLNSRMEDTEPVSSGDVKCFSPQLRSGRAVSKRFMDSLANLRGKSNSAEKKPPSMADEMDIKTDHVSDNGDSDPAYEQMGDLVKPLLQQVAELANSKSHLEDREIQVVYADEGDAEAPAVKLQLEEADIEGDEDLANLEHDYSNTPDTEDQATAVAVNTVKMLAVPVLPRKRSLNPSGAKDPDWNLPRRPKKRITDRAPVQCDVCGVTILGKNNLTNHKKRIHLKKKNFPCQICEHPFWSSHDRESHVLSVHTRQCRECNTYVTESEKWPEGVKRTTLREVVCVCGADVQIQSTFGRKRLYIQEEKKERGTSDTKYACGTCGKLFLKRTNCERHQRSHTDVKSHVCYVCGNAYSYENSLTKHLRNEHSISGCECEFCGKCFAAPISLNIHISKHHPNEKRRETSTAAPPAADVPVAEVNIDMEMEHAVDQPQNIQLDTGVPELKVLM